MVGGPDLLEWVSEELRNDKEVVLERIKWGSSAFDFRCVSEELRNDKEVALAELKHGGFGTFHYVSKELRNDREFILEAVKQNGCVLEWVSEEFKNDKEVVLEAVKQNGYVLDYASEELQKDKEVVLEAVKEYGPALERAKPEFKKDKEVVLEAVKKSGKGVLGLASRELRNDKEFIELVEKIIEEQEKAKHKEEKITPTDIEQATEDVTIGEFNQATGTIKESVKEEQEISNDEISINEE